MNEIYFSIVLPVYNSETTIYRAIESVLNQSFKEFELIIINDGSVDGSDKIICSCAEKDGRIIYIKQDNQGVSVARNRGIELASGKYILFLDSDDYYLKGAFKKLKDLDYDGLIFANQLSKRGKIKYKRLLDSKKTFSKSEWNDIIQNESINSPCNKKYNRKIIEKYKLRFPKNIELGEDLIFNLAYFSRINELWLYDEPLICFSDSGGDERLTAKFREERLRIRIALLDQIRQFLIEKKIQQNFISEIMQNMYLHDMFAYFMDLHNKNCPYGKGQKKKIIRDILKSSITDERMKEFQSNNSQNWFLYQIYKTKNVYVINKVASVMCRMRCLI